MRRRIYQPDGLEKTVKFGRWSPKFKKSPCRDLEWYVLCREIDEAKGIKRALLLSKYALFREEFDDYGPIWNDSYIRKILNGEFIERAFSAEEQARLVRVLDGEPFDSFDNVMEDWQKEWLTKRLTGDNDWVEEFYLRWRVDRVFMLSEGECLRYLPNLSDRICQLWEEEAPKPMFDCWWWLRSAYGRMGVRGVGNTGCFRGYGSHGDPGGAVRPALWINE